MLPRRQESTRPSCSLLTWFGFDVFLDDGAGGTPCGCGLITVDQASGTVEPGATTDVVFTWSPQVGDPVGVRLKSFGTTLVVVVVYGVQESSKVLSLLTPCPSLGYVWTVSTESVESPPRHPMCVIGSSSSPSV